NGDGNNNGGEGEEGNGNGGEAEAEAALFEESHILDFWQELACRHDILKKVEGEKPKDEFLGFSRGALVSYIKPVVLVDGQHRLRGSLLAARNKLNQPDVQREIERRIDAGEGAGSVHSEILEREARRLPVSLLLADDPAEQVFQFVVVNQKAIPIG